MKLLLLNFVYAYEAVNVCLRREFQQHSVRQYLTSSRSLYKAVGPDGVNFVYIGQGKQREKLIYLISISEGVKKIFKWLS